MSSHLWSHVAFDRWPTQWNIRALRRACPMTGRQACPRVTALSRRDQDREDKLVLPRLFALPHWQLLPLWVSWIFRGFPVRLSSNPFCSACIDAPESTANSRSSGFFQRGCRHYPCFGRRVKRGLIWVFELKDIFRQAPRFLRAHPSWCKVSSCGLSSNFGAHGLRS